MYAQAEFNRVHVLYSVLYLIFDCSREKVVPALTSDANMVSCLRGRTQDKSWQRPGPVALSIIIHRDLSRRGSSSPKKSRSPTLHHTVSHNYYNHLNIWEALKKLTWACIVLHFRWHNTYCWVSSCTVCLTWTFLALASVTALEWEE